MASSDSLVEKGDGHRPAPFATQVMKSVLNQPLTTLYS